MIIVIKRPWWKIWRHPCGGLNPLGWEELQSITTKKKVIHVSGRRKPNDGGGGEYEYLGDYSCGLPKWDGSRVYVGLHTTSDGIWSRNWNDPKYENIFFEKGEK